MARFLPLRLAPALLGIGSLVGTLALAPAQAAPTAAKPPATPAPAHAPPAPPPPPEDYYIRYGKILTPSDEPVYPYKLTMPSPGFAELRIPSKEELDMSTKLEQLAVLSDAEIRNQLMKWPPFARMSLADEGAMLTRIQQFRDQRSKIALTKAHQLGLLTMDAAQQAKFEKEYWDQQLALNRQLSQQLEPIVKAAQQKMNESLFREFSAPHPLAQAPKPPPPKPAAPAPANKTVAQPH